jgi:hypothetical protein
MAVEALILKTNSWPMTRIQIATSNYWVADRYWYRIESRVGYRQFS